MTSFFSGSEIEHKERRRPTSSHPRARLAQRFFGDEPRKVVPTPSIAVSYNHEMNAVDRGDQLRSYHGYKHPIRRGAWQALAWTFLLDTALINSYLLQRDEERSNWKPYKAQDLWREQVCKELIVKYHRDGSSRTKFKPGDAFTPISQHKHVKRGKMSPCKACKGHQVGNASTQSPARPALGAIDQNARPKRRQTEWGCDICDVAICTLPNCWYLYHKPIWE